MLEESIAIMADRICSVLRDNDPSVCLFGSVVLDDFRLGWSDIDILVLTDAPIHEDQANVLVTLRQTLTDEFGGNPYFRLFEGGFLSKEAFSGGLTDTVVYWGTSGQRITDTYVLDSFAAAEIATRGRLLYGKDIRKRFIYPSHEQFKRDIERHCRTIRQHGKSGCGWLLDIARGLYTLRTNRIIAKTAAGEWALAEKLAPDPEIMERAIRIRKNPLKYKEDSETFEWYKTLGGHIQEFADVLEKELNKM